MEDMELKSKKDALNIESILQDCAAKKSKSASTCKKAPKTTQSDLIIGRDSLRPRPSNIETQNQEAIADQTAEDQEVEDDPKEVEEEKPARKFTRKETLWARANEKRPLIKLKYNKLKQPIGPGSKEFPAAVRTLIRTRMFPVDKADWRDVPIEHKEKLIDDLSAIYVMEGWLKNYSLQTAVKKWRAFKADMKEKAFKTDDPLKTLTKDELLERCDDRIDPEQWKWLVNHWLSEKGPERSIRGKENRSKVVTPHTIGSKSFARVGDECAKEYGRDLGRPIEKGDLFAHVFGREPRGYVRGVGLGPTPATLGIDGYRSCASTTVQMAIRACQKTDEQNILLKDALHQLFDEVRELREIVKGGKGQEETLDDATDRASSPTLEHGSNPSPTTQMRGVSSDNSDHNVHEDMMNSHDADVMVPMRGRAPLQPTRGHEAGRKEVVLLSVERPCGQPMAKATLQTSNPEARVGGSLLGAEYHEVVVNSVMRGDHILPRQYGKLKTLTDCVGHSIAWPHLNIVNEERAKKHLRFSIFSKLLLFIMRTRGRIWTQHCRCLGN